MLGNNTGIVALITRPIRLQSLGLDCLVYAHIFDDMYTQFGRAPKIPIAPNLSLRDYCACRGASV